MPTKLTPTAKLRCDGALIMWGLAEFSYLQVLHNGLENLGYDKSCLPNPRTNGACLKDALAGVFRSPTTLIRPLKTDDGTTGFVVVQEQRYNDRNFYNAGLTAKVNDDAAPPRIQLAPYDENADKITRGFNDHLGLIRGPGVTNSLTAIIAKLGGTTPRPGGCVYWLPQNSLDQWVQVCEAVKQSAHDGKNCMYIVRHELDHDAVQCVQDSIVAEITEAADKIGKEVMEDGLGERALERRRDVACRLREKITMYEEILSLGLGQLRKNVDNVEIAIAQATLLATANKQVA